MITKRTSLLQIETAPNVWQWVFCYVANRGTVATCADYRKALRAADLAYIASKTTKPLRAVRPVDVPPLSNFTP